MGDIVITPASNDVNSTAGTLIIRTSDAQAMSLKTSDTDRVYITSAGNVGIGLTNPSEKTQITGNLKISPLSSSWAEGISFSMPQVSTWGGLRWRRERANADGNHYVGYIGSDATDDLVFGSNNAGTQIDNNIRITKAGRVGINTSAPLAILSVGNGSLNDVNVPVQISSAGPGTEKWFGANRSGGYGLLLGYYEGSSLAGSGAYVRQVTSDPLHFLVNNSTTAMSIISNGNIGMGVTTPSQKLDVNGAIIAGINNSYGAYTRTPGGVLKPWFATASANTFFYNTNVSGSTFWQNAADTATLMSLTEQGRLGINTNDPSGRLHVLDTSLYAPSLTWNSTAAAIIRSENGQIAFGSDSSNPYGIWQQVRTTSNTARPLLLNPLGGNIGIGTTNPFTKLRVDGSFSQKASGSSNIQEYKNIVNFVLDNNGAGGYVIKTPFQIGNSFEMAIVHVKGYGYGTSSLFDFKVVFYDYGPSNAPINYSLVDLGNDGSPKYLAKDANNYMQICFGSPSDPNRYFYRFTVDCITTRNSTDWSQGWGMSQTTGTNFGFASTGLYLLDSPISFNVSNNYVGIGKTNPAVKLDVAGTIRSSTSEVYSFGSSDNVSLRAASSVNVLGIYTSNVERLRVDANGYLGIGLAPSTLLSVGGAGSTSAASGLTFGADASVNLYRLASNVIRTDANFQAGASIYATTYLQAGNGNIFPNSYAQNLVLNVGNNAASNWESYPITLVKGCYVGIGTNVPSGKLHVVSSVAGETVLRADGTNGVLFSVVDDLSDSLMSVNNSAGLPVLEVFADDRVVMGQYGSGDFVLINNKIGVGTSNPANKLSVIGAASIGSNSYNISAPANGLIVEGSVGIGTTSAATYSSKIAVETSLTRGLMVFNPALANAGTLYGLGFGYAMSNYDSAYISFYKVGVGDTSNRLSFSLWNKDDILNINGAGNVGIGLTNPAAILNVKTSTQPNREIFMGDSAAVVGVFRARLDDNSLSFISLENRDINTVTNHGVGIRFNLGTNASSNAINAGGIYLGKEQTWTATASTQDSYLIFNTSLDGTAVEKVRITSAGNVGIGTINPSGKLSVDFAGVSAFNVCDSFSSNVRVTVGTVNTAGFTYGLIQTYQHNTDAAGVSPLNIQPFGGNVGIGTSVPTGLLNVTRNSNTAQPIAFFKELFGSPAATNILLLERGNNLSAANQTSSNAGLRIRDHSSDYSLSIEDHNSNVNFAISGSKVLVGSRGTNSLLNVGGAGSVAAASGLTFGEDASANLYRSAASTIKTDGNLVVAGATSFNNHKYDSKTVTLTTASYTTVLTISLTAHTSCYVKIGAFGDWGNHSAVAFASELFIQNGDNAYNTPGTIITAHDNTAGAAGDKIDIQIVDPLAAGTQNFLIQLKLISATSSTNSSLITYHVMGQQASVT